MYSSTLNMFGRISIRSVLSSHSAQYVPAQRCFGSLFGKNALSWNKQHGLGLGRQLLLSHQKASFCSTGISKKKLRDILMKLDQHFTVISQLFAKQCNALCALRIRRTAQIITLYKQLGYDHHLLTQVVNKLKTSLFCHHKGRPLSVLLGTVLFSWHSEHITEPEMKKYDY